MARPPSGARHDGSTPDGDFTEFVQASWPGLYRTAYLLVGDRGLAEDLAQTALAKTTAGRFRGCPTPRSTRSRRARRWISPPRRSVATAGRPTG